VWAPAQNPCNESVRLNAQSGPACGVVFRVQHLDGLVMRGCGDKKNAPVSFERHGRPFAECKWASSFIAACPSVLQLFVCAASNTATTTTTTTPTQPTGRARSGAEHSFGRFGGFWLALSVAAVAVGIGACASVVWG
jgi:hypothetical protein